MTNGRQMLKSHGCCACYLKGNEYANHPVAIIVLRLGDANINSQSIHSGVYTV